MFGLFVNKACMKNWLCILQVKAVVFSRLSLLLMLQCFNNDVAFADDQVQPNTVVISIRVLPCCGVRANIRGSFHATPPP